MGQFRRTNGYIRNEWRMFVSKFISCFGDESHFIAAFFHFGSRKKQFSSCCIYETRLHALLAWKLKWPGQEQCVLEIKLFEVRIVLRNSIKKIEWSFIFTLAKVSNHFWTQSKFYYWVILFFWNYYNLISIWIIKLSYSF